MSIARDPLITLDGVGPTIASRAYVARDAVIIGNVELLKEASIWYQCVLRGDQEPIRVGARSNIQDRVVIHTSGGCPVIIGSDVSVGHSAVVHGCTLQDGCLIGMGAIILDAALVETGAIVAAGAVVAPGKRVAGTHVWAGNPARPLRAINETDRGMIAHATAEYLRLSLQHVRAGGLIEGGMIGSA